MNRSALILLGLGIMSPGLVGQDPLSTWTASTAITANAGLQTNSLLVGTNLAVGQTVSASWAMPSPSGQTYNTVANSQFSATSIAGSQTFHIAQSSVVWPLGGPYGASTGGSSTITLTSASMIWARLSVSYTGTAWSGTGFPLGSASIDIGADGVVEWAAPQPATWQTIVPIHGTVSLRVTASVMQNTNRNLNLRLDYFATRVGTGSPVAAGMPTISPSGGSAAIGNATFAISGDSMTPNWLAILVLKAGQLLPLPGVQIPGAQPGCAIYVDLPEDSLVAAVASPTGNASYPLPIPSNSTLIGYQLGAQWFGWDPTLAFALPLGSSPALSIVVTN